MQTRQVLKELLEAQKFPGQEAAQVLPAILKIGVKLKDEEFKEKIAPLVVQLFAQPDRAVRFRLLTSMGKNVIVCTAQSVSASSEGLEPCHAHRMWLRRMISKSRSPGNGSIWSSRSCVATCLRCLDADADADADA